MGVVETMTDEATVVGTVVAEPIMVDDVDEAAVERPAAESSDPQLDNATTHAITAITRLPRPTHLILV